MFHLCAYSESQDSGGLLVNVAALADPAMTVSGDNIQIPDYAPYLMGAAGQGVTISRAQLQSPSLRRVVNFEIRPVNQLALFQDPARGIWTPENPIPLDVNEQLQALASETAAGAEQETVLVWLSDGPIAPVSGEIYTVRVTSAVTTVAYTWTNGPLVFDQVLPVGRYAVVGAVFSSTNMLAFRFLFQGSTPRPGGVGADGLDYHPQNGQRNGIWGSWGEFESTTPPTVDYLTSVANASEVGILDLIKVG